jgi:hypothetical protein
MKNYKGENMLKLKRKDKAVCHKLLIILALQLVVASSSYTASALSPMPDLIVDQAILRENWIVRDEKFSADACHEEGGITPGEHRVLRFSVSTPNIGNANLVVGDPNVHIANDDGLFELSTCHGHFHFRHYATYELIDPVTKNVWRSAKLGFCMIDELKYQPYSGPSNNKRNFLLCGAPGVPGNQGISMGWADLYFWKLEGQYFVMDEGDGQLPVPPGKYIIRITVNPGFVPTLGEPCLFADPLHAGVCHQLPESNYENNVAEIVITIPDHPGRQGVGPLKDQAAIS